ncbi:ubiquitin-conjugating enzyme/RWD-like protein [Protomyces lactucae-debilis]|uniref:Ubiquitin-conjugating enzyme/RWD-like protein n=1 Tax=Protomyces lactucae-debilis TaxID=2754530 RepID=A0A1Y2FDK8_PROLT|nr:ubiquitin-conjugating enzyme/RWD-like protein [Protomyces lactucae-debilis]ORY81504.1 ubiquitin-conjugating enzyme/RWD-like protein [Protomyces lactucae-debilis]
MASLATSKRLIKELRALQKSPNKDLLHLAPQNEDDLSHWTASFEGQSGTPFEHGIFHLKIHCPPAYPAMPPVVSFTTRVAHPNVQFKTGEICLDILKERWSPAWTLGTACTAVVQLLASPEPDSPLNIDLANLLRSGDILGYESLVRMYVEMYALPIVGGRS